jgi:hypothetical protein
MSSTHDNSEEDHVASNYEFMFVHEGYTFKQSNGENLRAWILLDNQSTVNVFCNPTLVRNVRSAQRPLALKCNAGTVNVTKVADLPGYPEPVWFHDKGIANVLSLA